jgi:hypothetical protein
MAAEFAALISELESFQKASGADDDKTAGSGDGKGDDKKIVAAAADGDKTSAKENPTEGEGSGDDKGKGEPFGKALQVTLADGSQVEAWDGSEMLKAMQTESGEMREQMDDMRKAFEIAVGVIRDLRTEASAQDTLLKSLQLKIASVGASPTGRKSMIAIAEKLSPGSGTGAGSGARAATEPTAASVMMKAQQMCRADALGWEALPRIEAFQGRGQLAPPDLLARFPELLTPVA